VGFAVFLVSLFLSSMSVFNAVIQKLSVLSLLNFYRPYRILHEGRFPACDLLTLLGIAVVCWSVGCLMIRRRDFRIV